MVAPQFNFNVDSSANFGVSTIMMCLLFGTNFLLFALFKFVKTNERPVEEVAAGRKELSKPFVGTVDCFFNLTRELVIVGAIMALTYICENNWIFPHSTKSYSRDLFLFVVLIFFLYGIYTIRPNHDLALLGREQTEEWKGWMQFIFLLYHYFHAEEVYNSVRVMITCYVWMTGFGNFSFFYVKQDYGWLRVVQMLWRLNFSVLLLMWTHGNTWILYYICPMHTFYFLMVYASMYVFSSVNHSKWGIRWKLLVIGVLIYIVWDINGGLFDILFAWLGTSKEIGATSGSVWEWYFRTSLDHWSSYLGMIFALNFPLAEQYFVKAKGWPLVLCSVLMGAAALWWVVYCYTEEKVSYNLTHSYFAIIPLTAYIFFRNITPGVRSYVSMSFHDLGKTTLETYLLQHHIWLTSNAKTLLTIVPEHPWINFALASVLFFFTAKELYRITMSLRGMILPDDGAIAFTNSIGATALCTGCFGIAYVLHGFQPSLMEIGLVCVGLTTAALVVIIKFTRVSEHPLASSLAVRAMVVCSGVFVIGVVLELIFSGGGSIAAATGSALAPAAAVATSSYIGNTRLCLDAISKGHWTMTKCNEPTATISSKAAYCQTNQWVWDTTICPTAKFSNAKLSAAFKGKKVAFFGDSQVRSAYHSFVHLLEPGYKPVQAAVAKGIDVKYSALSASTAVDFYWAPHVSNITSALGKASAYDVMVCGATYLDALNLHDTAKYSADLVALAKSLDRRNSTVKIWLSPASVVDANLADEGKKKFMSEKALQGYRSTFERFYSSNPKSFHTVLNPANVTADRAAWAVDGEHYTEEVYEVVAHMVANGYLQHLPSFYKAAAPKPYVPKVTGSMSYPFYGGCVLALSAVMLFLMDSFLGFGFLSLALFGRSYDWEAACGPLHRKLFGNQAVSQQLANAEAGESKQGLLEMEVAHGH